MSSLTLVGTQFWAVLNAENCPPAALNLAHSGCSPHRYGVLRPTQSCLTRALGRGISLHEHPKSAMIASGRVLLRGLVRVQDSRVDPNNLRSRSPGLYSAKYNRPRSNKSAYCALGLIVASAGCLIKKNGFYRWLLSNFTLRAHGSQQRVRHKAPAFNIEPHNTTQHADPRNGMSSVLTTGSASSQSRTVPDLIVVRTNSWPRQL